MDGASRQLAGRVRVEAFVDAPRQRSGEDDRVGAARQVAELVHQRVELGGRDTRAPLVDLGVRAGGRVEDDGRRPRLLADADEVVEDRLGGELLDDPRPRAAAGEPGRDDRDVEPLERPRHVDALATRERDDLAGAMPMPDLEDRDGQRAVERGVEGDGDDHAMTSGYEADQVVDRATRDEPGSWPRDPGRRRRGRRRAGRARRGGRHRRRAPRRAADPVARATRAPAAPRRARPAGGAPRPAARSPAAPARRTGSSPHPGSARAYVRRGSITSTETYCCRPQRSSASRSALRASREPAPSTAAVTVTPRAEAAATCDQPASRRVAGLAGDERREPAEEVVGRLDLPARDGGACPRRPASG